VLSLSEGAEPEWDKGLEREAGLMWSLACWQFSVFSFPKEKKSALDVSRKIGDAREKIGRVMTRQWGQ